MGAWAKYVRCGRLWLTAALALAGSLLSFACDRSPLASKTLEGLEIPTKKDFSNINLRDAAKIYEEACNDGNMGACTNLGLMHEQGRGIPVDPKKAASFYEKACQGGSAKGCLNLALAYHQGLGVTQDYGRATALFQKACDEGDMPACTTLAYLYDTGDGVTEDKATATALYQKACQGKDKVACDALKQRESK